MQTSIESPYLQIIAQTHQTPDAIAVLQGDVQLTYAQLHKQSNQLAHYLRQLGVDRNVRVGIMTQRGPAMILGILGILKAGGAYVPLDPDYPVERIRYILNHAEITTILTENSLQEKLCNCLETPLLLDTAVFLDEYGSSEHNAPLTQIDCASWLQESIAELPVKSSADDLMVVLYTSGSTGRPKGVMLNHRGYMNRLVWMQNTFQLKLGDRVAQKTSFCFDISVWELFWPLMTGATICPVAREIVLNPWDFAQWMNDWQINVMHFVPSLFGEFVNALVDEEWTFPNLRWLVFSGEALPVAFIQRWIDWQGMATGLANLYGPTEASIDVTAHLIEERPTCNAIPIGKPIDNVYIRILNDAMEPVRPGELGQLWIGGIQLAQGYLKDPEKTAAAFQPNPLKDVPGDVLYRSGDLAKELPDGSIEYHGRADHQVKIRGFRVELGEIESVLTQHHAVNEAAVLAVEDKSGKKRLSAWVSGKPVENRELKEHLGQKLPYYMIPQRIEWLDSLPKNHNGKLDRKALLSKPAAQPSQPAPVENGTSSFPLAPAQRWLVSYFDEPYQWAGYTRFRYHKALDIQAFNRAFNQILQQYPALRTVYSQSSGQWQQQVLPNPKPVQFHICDGSCFSKEQRDLYLQTKIQQIIRQLDLNQWPLFKLFIVKVTDSCYDMAMVAHHMIADLIAANILFKHIWDAYDREIAGIEAPETARSVTYLTYIEQLQTADQQGQLTEHLRYWQNQFPSPSAAFRVPFDDIKGPNVEASAAVETLTFTPAQTETLLIQAKQHYQCSVYMLLLAGLYRVMGDWAQRDWVVISHRGHGREIDGTQSFWQSFGNFAINYPMGLQVSPQEDWANVVDNLKEQFAAVPMNGITYDWLSDRLPDYLYPDDKLTPVRANYLGNRSITFADTFEFIEAERDRRLALPDQKRTTLLEFFFSVTDGQLRLTIEYSQNFHTATTIQQLCQRYEQVLTMILSVAVPQPALSIQ